MGKVGINLMVFFIFWYLYLVFSWKVVAEEIVREKKSFQKLFDLKFKKYLSCNNTITAKSINLQPTHWFISS